MLSRDLCEKLTLAYPEEIGCHSVVHGEEFWRGEADLEWCDEWQTGQQLGDLWSPRLEDLLAMADQAWRNVPQTGEEVGIGLWGTMNDWHFGEVDNTTRWDFFSGDTRAHTPEAAVAHWLLAVAEEKRPLDKEEVRRRADRILGPRKEGE